MGIAAAANPRYGKGFVTLGGDELPIDTEALTEHLTATFRSPRHSPPLPPTVALEVLRLSQNGEVPVDDIGVVLQKDPMLAGMVVKIASSPRYGGAQIRSLRDAVVRLGQRGLRDVILEAAMNLRVFRSKRYGAVMEQVRVHCVLVAHLARLVCRFTAVDAEHAFLCGLFHDVGAAAALIELEQDKRRDLEEAELAGVLSAVHLEGTRSLAAAWHLPPEVAFVVGNHHQLLHQGYPHPVIAALMYAEELLGELTAPHPWDSSQGDCLQARQVLGLTPKLEEQIQKAAHELLAHGE